MLIQIVAHGIRLVLRICIRETGCVRRLTVDDVIVVRLPRHEYVIYQRVSWPFYSVRTPSGIELVLS